MCPRAAWRTAVFFAMGLWLMAEPALALSTDREQPIHIEADRVTLDEGRGFSLYEGNVRLTQGSLRLEAHSLRVFATDRRLSRVVAEGDLAKLYQETDEGEEIRAEARTLEYLANKDTIILLENARMWQGPNTFASERIEYDLAREVVNAGGDTTGGNGGRVEVIIVPETAREPTDP